MRAEPIRLVAVLNPAPTLNAPVCASFTSTSTFNRSLRAPRRVAMFTSEKYPRRCTRLRLNSRLLALNLLCSAMRNSRRITLSRVLVLPAMSTRSMYTSGPWSMR